MNELAIVVAAMQQQIDELRRLIADQASVIETLRTQRAQTHTATTSVHLDREQRLAAVARLSAKFPHARSFTAAQVQAEIAETA